MYTSDEMAKVIARPEWQEIRVSMLGTTQAQKLQILEHTLKNTPKMAPAVYNYLNALKRGGQLPAEFDAAAWVQEHLQQ